MRCVGRNHQDQGLPGLARQGFQLGEVVDVDHHLADGGVEVQRSRVLGDLLDGLVEASHDLDGRLFICDLLLVSEAPDPVDESPDTGDSCR